MINKNAKIANLFAKQIVAGFIPACSYVRLCCKRHLDDLEKSKHDDYPFYFDEKEVEKRISFIQLLPHTKGEWAHKRQLITLQAWQIFGLACTFGWKFKEDNTRRFLESYWEVPRKNGKSIISAAVGITELCDQSEYGSEVYSGATTEKQAWEVFKPARLMVAKTPQLQEAFGIKINAKSLVIEDDQSKFEPLIGNPGDGSSPSCSIIDEYHEHDTNSMYDTMRTGMGARLNPLIFIITTAGENIAGPCYEKRQEVIEMLQGTIPNDRLFGWIWTVDNPDDWKSVESLKMANPNFGVSVYEKFLLSQLETAINNPRKQSAFKTKHLNIWVGSSDPFINLDKWKACENVLDISEFELCRCYLGVDLAAKTDLNALIKVYVKMIDGVRHYYIVDPKFYVPYDTAYFNDNTRLAETYQAFENSGHLTLVDGAEMDYRAILSEIEDTHEFTAVSSAGIDPHGATCLLHEMDEVGITGVIIYQNYTGMSDAMKELEAAILSKRIHHDGNPILTWCLSNLTAKYMAGNDEIMRPTKPSRDKKIDGAVALINALARAISNEQVEEYDSPYNYGQL